MYVDGMDDLANTRDLLNRQLGEAVTTNPLQALGAIGAVQRDVATHQRAAVRAAAQLHTWAEIGEALGVSKQAAHQKFAKEWASTLRDELKTEHKTLKVALKKQSYETAATAKAKADELIAELRGAHRK